MKHQCPHCGGVLAAWNRQSIIVACQKWVEANGAVPGMNEWSRSTADHPVASTVYRLFGSWNNMIEAAGYKPRRRGRQFATNRKQVVDAIYRWRFDHGELPTSEQWMRWSADRPNTTQVTRLFGSWNAAIIAAGYDPDLSYRSKDGYRHQAGMTLRVLSQEGRVSFDNSSTTAATGTSSRDGAPVAAGGTA